MAVIVTAALRAQSDKITRACTTTLVVGGHWNASFKCETEEEGTWVFSDGQHATRQTTFDNGEFTCLGTATKQPLPVPAPTVCLGS